VSDETEGGMGYSPSISREMNPYGVDNWYPTIHQVSHSNISIRSTPAALGCPGGLTDHPVRPVWGGLIGRISFMR